MKDVHCCGLHRTPPHYLSEYKKNRPLCPQIFKTTFWSPISDWIAGLHWIHTVARTCLHPSHETLSTHICAGYVGRQEGTHVHLLYGATWSFQKICVNFTYFSILIVRNCWNIKGCNYYFVDVIHMKTI